MWHMSATHQCSDNTDQFIPNEHNGDSFFVETSNFFAPPPNPRPASSTFLPFPFSSHKLHSYFPPPTHTHTHFSCLSPYIILSFLTERAAWRAQARSCFKWHEKGKKEKWGGWGEKIFKFIKDVRWKRNFCICVYCMNREFKRIKKNRSGGQIDKQNGEERCAR